MKKEEFIRRYGESAWEKKLQQRREDHAQHREEENAKHKVWCGANREKVEAAHHESTRKGGKGYDHKLKYNSSGIQGERSIIRYKHGRQYRPFKQIIARESQIHHQWIPDTANYTGVALVEKDQHQHGYIDVIRILEGEISLLTEEEIRMGVSELK